MKAQTLRENRVRDKEKRKTTTTTTKNKKKKQTNKKKGKKKGKRKEEEEVEKKKKPPSSLPSLRERSETPGALDRRARSGVNILAGKITAFPSAFRRPLSQHSCILINGNVCSHIHVLTICAAKIGF